MVYFMTRTGHTYTSGKCVTMAITKSHYYTASIKPVISILGFVLLLAACVLLTACVSEVETRAVSSPMQFTVPGGDRMLRAVEASTIEARYTFALDGQEPTEAIAMSRVGTSTQWETPQIIIPPNTGFLFELSWFAGFDGERIEYASQSFRSVIGVNSNQVFNLSELPYSFDDFDSDSDGVNNYEEFLAGTNPIVFDDEDTTDAGSLDMGATAGVADTGTADTGTADAGIADAGSADTGTVDTGTVDTGTVDTGTADAGTADTGTVDAGTVDMGTADAGTADTGTIDAGTADAGSTTTGLTDGGVITPSGTITGVWFGNNNFGEGVMIVDANENVVALSSNDSGQYETVFGPASGALERFLHRDSENPAFADSFTPAGDSPSVIDPTLSDTITYNLSVENDGQQINHTGEGGDFSMTFANENDLVPISVEGIAGNWYSKSSICPVDCNITLEMTMTDAGDINGFTQFNNGQEVPLNGSAFIAQASTQYLNIQFTWNETRRTGVLYFDRLDPTRLILNTIGPAVTSSASASFTASLIRR